MGGIEFIFLGLLILLLLPISFTDMREQRIPNSLNLAVALLGMGHGLLRDPRLVTLGLLLAQAVITFLLFAGTAWLMRRISRRAEIGWGDLKFLIAASLWVGVDGSVATLVVGCILYILWAAALAPWRGFRPGELNAFGPMLAVGMLAVVIVVFSHQPVIH